MNQEFPGVPSGVYVLEPTLFISELNDENCDNINVIIVQPCYCCPSNITIT